MIKNKKIAVFGLGVEGLASLKFFSAQNEVVAIDQKPRSKVDSQTLKFIEEKKIKAYFENDIINENFDIQIRSAGIRPDNPRVIELASHSKLSTTATQLFFELNTSQVIGVTGTKGKGTTATLIYKILKEAGKNVYLAGNIGTPMLEILPKLDKESWAILELSSFQLIDLKQSPHIAVILMVTSEHLDWHKNQEEYLLAKSKITAYQKEEDFLVVNSDFEKSIYLAKNTKAQKVFFSTKEKSNVFVDGKNIFSNQEQIMTTDVIKLPGAHNLQNVCAAIATAKILNIENKFIVGAVSEFKGLEHRLQTIGNFMGVTYINDSFSTTPETTIAAIDAFNEPKILILGGSSKKSDFSDLIYKLKSASSIKTLILIGEEGKRIKELLGNEFNKPIINNLESMKEIVSAAKENAQQGDLVLLSPACASFGMFENYKDRGNQFAKEVLAQNGK